MGIWRNNNQVVNNVKRSKEERRYGMKIWIVIYMGFKNLALSKMRSTLTIGGVALGIGIVTFLLCMGFGMQRLIVNEVTKNNPINIIDINNGSLDNFVALNDEMVGRIKSMEGVTQIERSITTGGKVSLNESQTDTVVFGADKEYLNLQKVNYKDNGISYDAGEPRAIVSDKLANLLGYQDSASVLGKKISLNISLTKDISSKISEEKNIDSEVEVVGVVERSDSAYIYIPFTFAKDTFGMDLAQSGKILVGDMNNFNNIKGQLEQMGFITESINDLINDINNFFDTMRIVLVVFGIIIMSISVMGILNTLSISLLQRTKEIGILKALGATRQDIFRMFVLDSIIISLIGGILGFAGGYGVSFLVNYGLMMLGKRYGVNLDYFVYMPWSFIMAVCGFILFLGIATGLMPAVRAARIHALEALRYE